MAHIIEITDLTAPELKIYSNLTGGDPRRGGSTFLAESEKVIEYALKAGCKPLSFLMERPDASPLVTQWPEVPVYTGSRQIIRALTGYTLDRGFLCALERPALPAPAELFAHASRVVVLRNISDPTDLGAVFRSAAALGMDAIVIGEGCCDPLYRRCVRVSMGTVFQVPWAFADHTDLPPDDFACVTVSEDPDGRPLTPESCTKLCVILDPKARGNTFRIPIARDTEPLNMASASAVLFWMLRKQ